MPPSQPLPAPGPRPHMAQSSSPHMAQSSSSASSSHLTKGARDCTKRFLQKKEGDTRLEL